MEEKLTEEVLHSDEVYHGLIFDVTRNRVRLPNGGISMREVIRHKGAVCILPLTEDGCVIVERQYRSAYGGVTLEIPAGKLDFADEDPLSAAIRELREETGATAASMTCMGEYWGSPAILRERIVMYLARDLTFGDTERDPDEFMNVVKLPLTELAEMVLRGEIPDGKTQCAVLRAAMLRERGEI